MGVLRGLKTLLPAKDLGSLDELVNHVSGFILITSDETGSSISTSPHTIFGMDSLIYTNLTKSAYYVRFEGKTREGRTVFCRMLLDESMEATVTSIGYSFTSNGKRIEPSVFYKTLKDSAAEIIAEFNRKFPSTPYTVSLSLPD